jgi:hypothetical protein
MKIELADVRNSHNEALLALQFQMNYLEKDSMILTGKFSVAEVTTKQIH